MKTLQLIIKQNFFDEIIAGTKPKEFREIRPNTMRKYCQVDSDGFVKEVEGVIQPREYDAIQFYVGYAPDRNSALVEIKDAEVSLLVDDDDNFITYLHDGEEYTAAQIAYSLGRVIEKNV